MASAASILKNHLACCVEKQDFIIMLSYTHCTHLNKLLHLCKQDHLLKKHTDDFLQHDIKKISELKELDCAEEKD